jgi:hypothetical protein
MIVRCPRLRVLTVTIGRYLQNVIVHSVSLEELELDFQTDMKCRSIRIVTPLLKQLKLKVHGNHNMDFYISAPVVEQVSWYTTLPLIIGLFWWLQTLRLETRESCADRDGLIINHEELMRAFAAPSRPAGYSDVFLQGATFRTKQRSMGGFASTVHVFDRSIGVCESHSHNRARSTCGSTRPRIVFGLVTSRRARWSLYQRRKEGRKQLAIDRSDQVVFQFLMRPLGTT